MTVIVDWTVPFVVVVITEVVIMSMAQAGICPVTVYLDISFMWVPGLTENLYVHTKVLAIFSKALTYIPLRCLIVMVIFMLWTFSHYAADFCNCLANVCVPACLNTRTKCIINMTSCFISRLTWYCKAWWYNYIKCLVYGLYECIFKTLRK